MKRHKILHIARTVLFFLILKFQFRLSISRPTLFHFSPFLIKTSPNSNHFTDVYTCEISACYLTIFE